MKAALKNIIVEVTTDCNLDCRYCYNHWKGEDEFQPLNSYKKAVKMLKHVFKQSDVERVTFTGGEPFMSERFIELVLFCRINGKTVSIISNGTVANHPQYQQCINLGVSHFQFPVLAHLPDIHDGITGVAGSWQNVLNSINAVLQMHGRVVPVLVLTQMNAPYLEQTIRFIHSLGLRQLMLNRYNIGGKYRNSNTLSLSKIDVSKAFEIANLLTQELGMIITSNVCSPMCYLNPDDYPNIAFGHCSFDMNRRPITFTIEGDVRLCNHSPVVAGNIFENDLQSILQSEYCKSWETSKPEFCANCTFYEKCKGGCRAASEQMGQGLAAPDPVLFRNIEK